MIGIEFVKNQKTKEPFSIETNFKTQLMEACFKEGLIVYPGGGSVDGTLGDQIVYPGGGSVDGTLGDHILLAPPINVTKEEIDIIFEKLEIGIKVVNDEFFN